MNPIDDFNSEERKNSEKQKKEFYEKRYASYLEEARAMRRYSIQRFDILIIALSTGGILVTLNMIKFLIERGEYCCHMQFILVITIIIFGSSIICNLLSQYIAYRATSRDCDQMTEALMRIEGIKDDVKEDYKYNNLIEPLNVASLILLMIGMIATILYLAF
jgi:hypothetical protein